MRVLVACECTQVVCAAFRRVGCEAYSCDLLPAKGGHPEWHFQCDVLELLECLGYGETFDLMIAHPPCTMLTHSSAVALSQGKHTMSDVESASIFFKKLLDAPIARVCIENPAPMKICDIPRYNQILQPYEFGHPFSKRVCLWLRNLPPLLPTRGYFTEHQQWLRHCSSKSLRRATTFEGIAEAMALQWGTL